MTKRADPGQVWAAYQDGHRALREWLGRIAGAGWTRDSVLPGWTVADLVAHVAAVADSVAGLAAAPRPAAALPLDRYIAGYAPIADVVAERARDIAGASAGSPEAILGVIDERFNAAAEHIERIGLDDKVVAARRGPIQLSDHLLTRVIEIVVHADDLAQSVSDVPGPRVPREAERMAVRALLDVLAAQAPGRTVEVRVPPYAAVQCVEGPRHTRGTPPNVVEMDAPTWIRLAAGRVAWADEVAAARVSASGDRADFTAYLPLL